LDKKANYLIKISYNFASEWQSPYCDSDALQPSESPSSATSSFFLHTIKSYPKAKE